MEESSRKERLGATKEGQLVREKISVPAPQQFETVSDDVYIYF